MKEPIRKCFRLCLVGNEMRLHRTSEREDQQLLDELIPARIVTLLEVFVRTWIEELIDKGAPYVERAASLKAEIKYDFAIARSLHGGLVAMGQLPAQIFMLLTRNLQICVKKLLRCPNRTLSLLSRSVGRHSEKRRLIVKRRNSGAEQSAPRSEM